MNKIFIVTAGETTLSPSLHLAALSEKGMWQASCINTTLETSFGLILYAPTAGASQTAHIIAGVESALPERMTELCYQQGGEDEHNISMSLKIVGDTAPISEHFRRGMEDSLRRLGSAAHMRIMNLIEARKPRSTLIIADPLIAPVLAFMMSEKHHSSRRFTERALGPCQGYMLSSNGNGFVQVAEI
ncbi:MAG: hypothetical protein RLY66_376 [Candidatus Parcubacteria bacterium]|jgi:hypothetical protein